MEETESAYFILAYIIVLFGTFAFTKGIYKERTARVILAIISPFVFMVAGPLLAIVVTFFFNLILLPLYYIGLLKNPVPTNHMFGITFICSAILICWSLWGLSKQEEKKKMRKEALQTEET